MADENIDLGLDSLEVPPDSGNGGNVDEILQGIETMFGGASDDNSDGKPKPEDSPSIKNDDPFGMKNMPSDPEALLRKLQSERDSTRAKLQKVEQEMTQYKSIADFMTSLYEDQELKQAFIAELAPDLAKPKDPLSFIQERLKKEFGDDFTPNKEETAQIGTRSWLYNERAKDLFAEYKDSNKKLPGSLKELREKRKKAKDEQSQAALLEKKDIATKMKWDEETWNGFADWVGKVKGIHMAKIYNGLRQKTSSAPFLAGQNGGKPLTGSQYKAELDKFFGPN